MSDTRQLAGALQAFPGVKSVGVLHDKVTFFVDDAHIARVLRSLQARLNASPAAGQVSFSVTFDEAGTVGFRVVVHHSADIDGFTMPPLPIPASVIANLTLGGEETLV